MSLRAFHIVFILISIAFFVGFGVREVRFYQDGSAASHFAFAAGSFALAAVTAVYLVWFVRKKAVSR